MKIFARAKPGITGETVEEEEAAEEEMIETKKKHFYDEQPIEQGWKVSGTAKNLEKYKRPPFVHELVQVSCFLVDSMILSIVAIVESKSRGITQSSDRDACDYLRYNSRSRSSTFNLSQCHRYTDFSFRLMKLFGFVKN